MLSDKNCRTRRVDKQRTSSTKLDQNQSNGSQVLTQHTNLNQFRIVVNDNSGMLLQWWVIHDVASN